MCLRLTESRSDLRLLARGFKIVVGHVLGLVGYIAIGNVIDIRRLAGICRVRQIYFVRDARRLGVLFVIGDQSLSALDRAVGVRLIPTLEAIRAATVQFDQD